MKRLATFALGLALLAPFALVGCGEEGAKPAGDAGKPAAGAPAGGGADAGKPADAK